MRDSFEKSEYMSLGRSERLFFEHWTKGGIRITHQVLVESETDTWKNDGSFYMTPSQQVRFYHKTGIGELLQADKTEFHKAIN